jgi:hypothetical protein
MGEAESEDSAIDRLGLNNLDVVVDRVNFNSFVRELALEIGLHKAVTN